MREVTPEFGEFAPSKCPLNSEGSFKEGVEGARRNVLPLFLVAFALLLTSLPPVPTKLVEVRVAGAFGAEVRVDLLVATHFFDVAPVQVSLQLRLRPPPFAALLLHCLPVGLSLCELRAVHC